jgi:hypothetical protein
MARCMVPAALALGILATSLPSAAQPARQPAPPPPVGARKVDDGRAAAVRRRRTLLKQGMPTSRQAREKMAQLTDEQVAAQLQELIRKASVKEGEYCQAGMEAKDVREAHDAADDEQKPDLFVLRVEADAKARVLQRETEQLGRSVNDMTQEDSRRHRKRMEAMTKEQLKAHLRDLVRESNAAKRRHDGLKATAKGRGRAQIATTHAAALGLAQLVQEVRDAEDAYRRLLMAQ